MSDPTSSLTQAPPGRPAPLWRNLSFTLMWTSTAASGFGDRMIMLAALALLGGLVEGTDNATAIQASTQVFFFLPYILFSLPAGWLADRLPRKWLLLTCDEVRGLILLLSAVAIASATGPADLASEQHWKVYAALIAIGTFAAIFNPTRNAIIPQIIPLRQLQSGNAVILVINIVASMIGTVIGGKIINVDEANSVQTGLMMGALFYLVSGTFFAFLKPTRPPVVDNAPPRSFWQAAKYVANHKRVIALMAMGVLVWASAAAVSSGILGVAKSHYGLQGNELMSAFTWIYAMLGIGLLVGAVIVVAMNTRKQAAAMSLSALIGVGICLLLFVMVPWMPMTYASTFLIGLFGNIVIINVVTLLQSVTPNYMRGRVMGINSMINTIFSVATYLAIWRLPSADTNIVYALYVLGGLLIVVGGVCLIRFLTRGPMPNRTANTLWRLNQLACLVWHRLTVVGREHVPSQGPVILAANHPSALDPFILQAGTRRMIRWVMLTQYKLRIAAPLWRAVQPITLDRDGGDTAKLRSIIGTLKDGDIVGLFPEGGLQRSKRELQPMEPGIGMIAKRSNATIVPVWITGPALSDHMTTHMLRPSRSTVTFGKPYTPAEGQGPKEITEDLRERLIAISKILD